MEFSGLKYLYLYKDLSNKNEKYQYITYKLKNSNQYLSITHPLQTCDVKIII